MSLHCSILIKTFSYDLIVIILLSVSVSLVVFVHSLKSNIFAWPKLLSMSLYLIIFPGGGDEQIEIVVWLLLGTQRIIERSCYNEGGYIFSHFLNTTFAVCELLLDFEQLIVSKCFSQIVIISFEKYLCVTFSLSFSF